MFGFISGHYSAVSAFTMASYGHDRHGLRSPKLATFFETIFETITEFLRLGPLHSGLFFLLSSNSELNMMLSMMTSAPTLPTPHTKRIHLCYD